MKCGIPGAYRREAVAYSAAGAVSMSSVAKRSIEKYYTFVDGDGEKATRQHLSAALTGARPCRESIIKSRAANRRNYRAFAAAEAA